MKLLFYLTLMFATILCGCHSAAPKSNTSSRSAVDLRNNAYSLLYDLMNDEKNVSKLLVIKRDSRELNRLIKEISTAAESAVKQLEEFHATSASVALNTINLPPGEAAARKAIATSKTKELLGNSGDTFECLLLLTQIQALNYGTHLAAVAADHETNSLRAAWLKSLSQDLKKLYSQCVELVARTPHGR